MSTEELPPFGRTLCAVDLPHGHTDPTGHAVMFAPGGEFAGRRYRYGERIVLCLRHADDVCTARRNVRDKLSFGAIRLGWLKPDANRLPLPILPEHNGAMTPRPPVRPAYPIAARVRRVSR